VLLNLLGKLGEDVVRVNRRYTTFQGTESFLVLEWRLSGVVVVIKDTGKGACFTSTIMAGLSVKRNIS
jgi:hypothetical protein